VVKNSMTINGKPHQFSLSARLCFAYKYIYGQVYDLLKIHFILCEWSKLSFFGLEVVGDAFMLVLYNAHMLSSF
jgi:hypothetical protein